MRTIRPEIKIDTRAEIQFQVRAGNPEPIETLWRTDIYTMANSLRDAFTKLKANAECRHYGEPSRNWFRMRSKKTITITSYKELTP